MRKRQLLGPSSQRQENTKAFKDMHIAVVVDTLSSQFMAQGHGLCSNLYLFIYLSVCHLSFYFVYNEAGGIVKLIPPWLIRAFTETENPRSSGEKSDPWFSDILLRQGVCFLLPFCLKFGIENPFLFPKTESHSALMLEAWQNSNSRSKLCFSGNSPWVETNITHWRKSIVLCVGEDPSLHPWDLTWFHHGLSILCTTACLFICSFHFLVSREREPC